MIAAGATVLRAGGVQITLDPLRIPAYVDGDEPGCLWLGPKQSTASRASGQVVNLVPNPSFEQGVQGWESGASPSIGPASGSARG